MAKYDFHARLMWLIQKPHRMMMNYLSSLSEGERSASGSFEAWAPKDRLSHITYWKRRAVETLSYLSRGQTPPEYPPYEECNRLNFNETCNTPFQMLVREAENALEALQLVLQRFTEEELREIGGHPRQKESTLLAYILGGFYIHPLFHISEAYLKLGDSLSANRLQDQLVDDILSLDNTPRMKGGILYDRACFAALSGDSARALEIIQESLALRPDLKRSAREEPDLVSLSADPRFISLTSD